jgi:hypothetical protein
VGGTLLRKGKHRFPESKKKILEWPKARKLKPEARKPKPEARSPNQSNSKTSCSTGELHTGANDCRCNGVGPYCCKAARCCGVL